VLIGAYVGYDRFGPVVGGVFLRTGVALGNPINIVQPAAAIAPVANSARRNTHLAPFDQLVTARTFSLRAQWTIRSRARDLPR